MHCINCIRHGACAVPERLLAQAPAVKRSFGCSVHALHAAVVYLTLGTLLARVQPHRRLKAYVLTVSVALMVLVGSTRVYLGVHWPTDVLAGWAAGAAWAILWWLITFWLQQRGSVE